MLQRNTSLSNNPAITFLIFVNRYDVITVVAAEEREIRLFPQRQGRQRRKNLRTRLATPLKNEKFSAASSISSFAISNLEIFYVLLDSSVVQV